MKRSKKYVDNLKLYDRVQVYEPLEAFNTLEKFGKAKFDETVEVAIRLGVDPRHADQQVRGTVVLPNGTGKSQRVLVFAEGDLADAAKAAGADYVGGEEFVDKILKENWFEFDVCVAAPNMMRHVGRLGRVLGPKGLMPNPKSGTVTADVARAIEDIKSGKVEYRVDKASIAHVIIGKMSFGAEKLNENMQTLMNAVLRAKPSASKGTYLKSIVLSSTMSPGIKINTASFSL